MKQIHNVILYNFREITLYNMDEGTDDDSPQSEPVFLSCHEIICFLDALASLDSKLSVGQWVIYRFQLAHLRVFQII